jgi:hypothetical protein
LTCTRAITRPPLSLAVVAVVVAIVVFVTGDVDIDSVDVGVIVLQMGPLNEIGLEAIDHPRVPRQVLSSLCGLGCEARQFVCCGACTHGARGRCERGREFVLSSVWSVTAVVVFVAAPSPFLTITIRVQATVTAREPAIVMCIPLRQFLQLSRAYNARVKATCVAVMKASWWFHDWSDEDVAYVANEARLKEVPSGQCIVKQVRRWVPKEPPRRGVCGSQWTSLSSLALLETSVLVL